MVAQIRLCLLFVIGYTIGVLLALLFFTSQHPDKKLVWMSFLKNSEVQTNIIINHEFSGLRVHKEQVPSNLSAKNNPVLLLCVMFVKNLRNAYSSSNTWMEKCNNQLYFGAKSDKYLNIVTIKMTYTWFELCNVFRYIFNSFNSTYHWILFSNDNNFVIPDNLRQFVGYLNYSDKFYFGHEASFWNVNFNSGRSTYVISKGTLDALMSKFTSNEKCSFSGKKYKNMADYYLGKHLSSLGIYTSETRDDQFRHRFHVDPFSFLLNPEVQSDINDFEPRSIYKNIKGDKCCSPSTISFPVTSNSLMYFYNYLLYEVHFYKDARLVSSSDEDDQVWKNFIRENFPDVNISTTTAEKYYKIWNDLLDPPTIFNMKLKELFLKESETL
uniref:Uncharacterized protein n=1 Tax=Clastoptera arizonana TaxID=38151 RepID=A0A1B6DUF3_9HEMI